MKRSDIHEARLLLETVIDSCESSPEQHGWYSIQVSRAWMDRAADIVETMRPSSAAKELAGKRWRGTNARDRSMHASDMAKARHAKLTAKQRSELMKKVRAAGNRKKATRQQSLSTKDSHE